MLSLRPTRIIPAIVTMAGVLLFLILIPQIASGADLIASVDTDASANATYDDGWIDADYWMGGWDISFTGDLTINATGLVDANASAVLDVDGGVTVGGVLNLNNGEDHELGGLILVSGGVYNATSETTTITNKNGLWSLYSDPGTLIHNDGTITISTSSWSYLFESQDLYNLVIDGALCAVRMAGTIGIINDFTIPEGTLISSTATGNGNRQLDVGGDVSVSGTMNLYYGINVVDNTISGSLTINSGGSVISGQLTVVGDVSVSGTLDCQASTVSMGSLTVTATGDCTLSSGTTTITSKSGNNMAVWTKAGSTLVHSSGLVSMTLSGAGIYMQGSGGFYDVLLTSAKTYYKFGTIENDLTVQSGVVAGSSATVGLTVGGDVIVEGGILGRSDGTATNTFGSLVIESGGTYEATSGTTEITGAASGYALHSTGIFAHNDGTVSFTSGAANTNIREDGTGNFYDLIINHATADYKAERQIIVDNNLTIIVGSLKDDGGGRVLTVAGDISVSGTLDWSTSSNAISFGSLTIESGGVLESTSGTLSIHGDCTISSGGGFEHNYGTVDMTLGGLNSEIRPSGATFFKLTKSGNAATYLYGTATVIDELSGGSSSVWRLISTSFITIGNTTHAGTIDSIHMQSHGASIVTVRGASEDYPAVINHDWDVYGVSGSTAFKWIDMREDEVTGGTGHSISIEGCCEFDALTISSGDTLDLNGHAATINGTFTTDGTLTTGTTSSIHLTENASWDMNQAIIVSELEIDCPGFVVDHNITFTGSSGFQNSSALFNVTGTANNLIVLTSTDPGILWNINPGNFPGVEWYWLYANVSYGNNTNSTTYMTILGTNATGNEGLWDFSAPVVVLDTYSHGGDYWLPDNVLRVSWTVYDLSFIHTLNYSLVHVETGIEIEGFNYTYLDIGMVSQYTHVSNITLLQEDGILPGPLRFHFVLGDAHNKPAGEKNIEKARKLQLLCEGRSIGYDYEKKLKDIGSNYIVMMDNGTSVFSLEFLTGTKSRQYLSWTNDSNFKLLHRVKTEMIEIQDEGSEITVSVIGVKMKITGIHTVYLPDSQFYGHFIFYDMNGELGYFYDMQDFKDEGGEIRILEEGEGSGTNWYILLLTHPNWTKNSWQDVDPLSGIINSNERTIEIDTSFKIISVSADRSHEKRGEFPAWTLLFIILAIFAVAILTQAPKNTSLILSSSFWYNPFQLKRWRRLFGK